MPDDVDINTLVRFVLIVNSWLACVSLSWLHKNIMDVDDVVDDVVDDESNVVTADNPVGEGTVQLIEMFS